MCKFKSAIILKDRVYIPDTDSHTDMLEQLKIKDDYLNAQKTFVRAELYPDDEDFFSDIEKWTFKVDQDILPDWFDETVDRPRMAEAVKEWAKNRIYIGIDGLELKDGANYMLKDCTNVILHGSSKVNGMYDNSKVNSMYDNSEVNRMYDNSRVNGMYGNSEVNEMNDNSKVNGMYGNSRVNITNDNSEVNRMYGSSLVNICSKEVNVDTIILCDSSTIRDFNTKTIYQSGDWKLVRKN